MSDDYDQSCPCQDCGAHTADLDVPNEWYMVRDDVWPAGQPGGHLCIGCLEARIGRTLVFEDFTGARVNDPTWTNKSNRLLARLLSRNADEVPWVEAMLRSVEADVTELAAAARVPSHLLEGRLPWRLP